MLEGLGWAGERKGLSAWVFEVGAGVELEFVFRAGEGDDGMVCSFAG